MTVIPAVYGIRQEGPAPRDSGRAQDLTAPLLVIWQSVGHVAA